MSLDDFAEIKVYKRQQKYLMEEIERYTKAKNQDKVDLFIHFYAVINQRIKDLEAIYENHNKDEERE